MKEKLEKLGFSPKEADVYLALLELGTAVVSDVAKKANINRSTTYILLDSLVDRGLVSVSEKNNVKLFSVTPAESITQYIQGLARQYTELVDIAQNIVPQLKSLYLSAIPKSRVKFFQGVNGLKNAYEDTLTSKETIRAYASIENMHKALPGYFPEYYQRRAGKNIFIRAIFPDTPESRDRVKHNKEEARESLLVPSDKYSFSPEINIYDNKIVFMSWLEKFALIIESQELAEALKKIFELSWIGVKTLDKKRQRKNKQKS
ncbi:MAG: helix-turn-helix domain-containing protein [Patescibacteria group bacterium]